MGKRVYEKSYPNDGTAELLAKPMTKYDPELKRDAERYRFLRDQHQGKTHPGLDADGFPISDEPTLLAFVVFHPQDGTLVPVGSMPGELDETVDRAMNAPPQHQEE